MEIITFDHQVFRDLSNKIDKIAEYVFKKETIPAQELDIWLTSEELADLLKISTRTLQRMRKDRTIAYSMPILFVKILKLILPGLRRNC